MYDVDLCCWILVSWMSMMCGFLCSVCVSSWMPGRLELMQPVFQVIIDRVVVWWCVVCVFAGGG